MKRIDTPETDYLKATYQFEMTGEELAVIAAAMNNLSPNEANGWATNHELPLAKQNWDDGSAINTVLACVKEQLKSWDKK
ncbi:hypothetical protein [Pseudarthrobacter oxydans]|uniref:hypothetical protein n=1 Tax=Pseudarthrobacter oxydans TaxID=1671 RepID=UPI0035EA9CB2|nr:hypothetical protein GCM10017547_38560 [Pseudarthrobacter oxydans]